MGEFLIKLPDVGEGVAEAELVEWLVEEGANVREDEALAAVMTDKATVEIPSPVEGKIIWLGAKVGEVVAVGSPIIRLEIDGEGNIRPGEAPAPEAPAAEPETAPAKPAPSKSNGASAPAPEQRLASSAEAISAVAKPSAVTATSQRAVAPMRKEGEKPLASPAIRKRAADAGIDLRRVAGSGPAGRITHEDLDTYFARGDSGWSGGGITNAGLAPDMRVTEIPVIGLRRKIAEKMQTAKSRIPHITYVDEIDMTALEDLRKELNDTRKEGRPKLTVLPFLMRAMVKAIAEQPQLNSIFDDDAGVVHQYGGCHIGVAAQTPNGLMVPVVRHAEARDVWDCASEIARLSDAARDGAASREELSGSTITITSLGAMGGIVTTPVINHPEVAIIGVNKMQVLPKWDGAEFRPRKVMNLSSSFDHRVIDGWDAAVFIQKIKSLLETPALIFIND